MYSTSEMLQREDMFLRKAWSPSQESTNTIHLAAATNYPLILVEGRYSKYCVFSINIVTIYLLYYREIPLTFVDVLSTAGNSS